MRNFIRRYTSAVPDHRGQTNELRVGAVDADSDGISIQFRINNQFAVLSQPLVVTFRDELAAFADTPGEVTARLFDYEPPVAWFADAKPLKSFGVRRGTDGWGISLTINSEEAVLTEAQARDLARVIGNCLDEVDGFRPEQSGDEVTVTP